ncbi:class I poly(R)-hydroxyalkanoic acid synthase [Aestuariivirga litoralis]|nr:class I poly(R)-hydroxyalkanoic acid synthase [Aestuariivirga litoralis]
MSDQKPPVNEFKLPDMLQLAQNMTKVFERGAELFGAIAARPDLQQRESEIQILPMEQVAKTLGEVYEYYKENPARMMAAQMQLWQSLTMLWHASWAKALGQQIAPMIAPSRSDKRFKDRDWQENSVFDFMKQAYLISAKWMQDMVAGAELDEHTKLKAKFYVEQIVNAFSPSNFPISNPEVLKATLASNGQNLLRGMDKLEADFRSPDGRLRITQTDKNAFEVGRDLALSPGKVVFRNDVFELIQYSPSTEQVYEIPLLIVPPWINKFYILDLNPQKSFVKYCVENGITVFMVSWINASEAQGRKSFSDYMREGFLTAVDAALKASGAKKVNTVGFCIGGTLVSAALGYMAAKNDARVNAATFFTTQVDFEKAGDLCVYVDEEQVKWIEGRMEDKGYLPGSRMADAFNLLRSNDLIWSCVVNNYLLGKDPMPFDLLYWNSDSTRMPAGVHSFYLRECYLNNRLSHGNMVLENTRIDLSKVKIPIYNLAARDDHIAPLPSVFRLQEHFGGPVKLVVSGSGHIAGVVNPPAANKYQHWTNETHADTLEEWMAGAKETAGSWWPDWLEWVGPKSGAKVKALVPGEGALPALGDAPGEYVKAKGE